MLEVTWRSRRIAHKKTHVDVVLLSKRGAALISITKLTDAERAEAIVERLSLNIPMRHVRSIFNHLGR